MDDEDLLRLMRDLLLEERVLRDRLSRGEISLEQEHQRLARLEAQLDECWDLLRERRAHRAAGLAPDEPSTRPEWDGTDFPS